MYPWGDMELSEEEVDKVLHGAAKRIQIYGMETVAILTLESVKPMVYVGGELSRVVLAPFLPALGPQYNMLGEKLIYVFEDRKNIEKLIQILEQMTKGEYKPPVKELEAPAEEAAPGEEPPDSPDPEKGDEAEKPQERKGWRRWLPF
ncbi:MAG TPA: hypothetical protein VMW22_06795 [Candidatus Desulfaltia sp.]|nr:hypothetical protein [Candidatus Desulfaltia sp.]